jgi:hypothetical protein
MSRRVFLAEQLPLLQNKGAKPETVLNLCRYLAQVDELSSVGFFAVLCVLYEGLSKLGLDEQQGRKFLLGQAGLDEIPDQVRDEATKSVKLAYERWNKLLSGSKIFDIVLALTQLHTEVSYLELLDIFSHMLCKTLLFEELAAPQAN